MPYVLNWLHCVWGTKQRIPYLTSENTESILNHIQENAKLKDINIDCINAYHDHVHCLLSLAPDQSLAKVMQLIKGESSFWINKRSIVKGKFEWAEEYYAASVSKTELSRIRNYIKNQEEHHREKTWDEEYQEFMNLYRTTIQG